MSTQEMKFGTKAIHAGCEPDEATGAIMTPIYQTSTYVQKSPGDHKGFEYSRSSNPTRKALEDNIAALENGQYGLAFASGMAATDCIMKLLNPGDEVISTNGLYGGTYRLFTKVYQNYGVKFNFTSMSDFESIEDMINEKTKLIWIETPTNPMCNIIDIELAAMIAMKHDLKLVVDNTFASPYLQNPIDLGADIVMHSATKYLGGHSDVVLGAVVTNDEEIAEQLYFYQNSCGAVAGPNDAWLVLRGIKTLHLRMQRHSENGEKIARYLRNHSKVDKVYWPGFEDLPTYEVAKRQMPNGFGGMMSFSLKSGTKEAAFKILENCKVFTLAESLGGVESLIGHPVMMTHASIPKEEREKTGIVDSLIRLSVGIEDIDDLIGDLEQALAKV
jgi:cystathionine beta-lyase